MNTIELIEKLNELAQLVKIFENPRNFIESKLTKKAGWEYVKPKPIKQLGQAFTSGYYSQYNAKKELINTFHEDQAWQSDYIQAAFKAEVRKVAGQIMEDCELELNDIDVSNLKEDFNTLLDWLVFGLFSVQEDGKKLASWALYAICHKMDVDLESEEA